MVIDEIDHILIDEAITLAPCFAATSVEKWQRIADEVKEVHASGRPVLVGTRTVAESRLLAAAMKQRGLQPGVVNGTQDEAEATIVARAGEADAITVATDMAGRGTDIILADDVAACGGLHVIITEPRHSPRLDRQLTGRCARQGQPGTSGPSSPLMTRCFVNMVVVCPDIWRAASSPMPRRSRCGMLSPRQPARANPKCQTSALA